MNLTKLSQMQRDLDAYIEEQHPVKEGENRFTKKCNALNRELGEFMEETREFKFWSNKPRADRDTILEEFVDVWHFLLSIGNDKGVDYENLFIPKMFPEQGDTKETAIFAHDINDLFSHAYLNASLLRFGIGGFGTIVGIMKKIGNYYRFTDEDVERAYAKKWEKNHKRQESGSY